MGEILLRATARAQGLSRYFTGKPCPVGHVAEREAHSGRCVVCRQAKDRRRYADDVDGQRERNRMYIAANRPRVLSRKARYRDQNRDSINAKQRAYSRANPGKIAALCMKRHADKLRRTPGWADRDKIEEVYATARFMREVTGQPWEVDHVIPLRGRTVSGLHVETNLQLLLKPQNVRKNNRYG